MSTRYDEVTLNFTREFGIGPQKVSVQPTWEETQDPRFVDFLEWFEQVRLSRLQAGTKDNNVIL